MSVVTTSTETVSPWTMGRNVSLAKEFPDTAEKLFEKTEQDARERFADYKKLAELQ